MKCLRCGKEIKDGEASCENCGFLVSEQARYEKVSVEVDPDLDDNKRRSFIDTPILTFILGILSMIMAGILLLSIFDIPIIFILIYLVFFGLTYFLSTRPCKINLKPIRTMGLILGYVSFVIAIFSIVFWIATLI